MFTLCRYQLQAFAILSSIFMTVVLALERYLAITKPIAYHNAIQGTNPWRRVLNYVVPVVLASALFNIPKFFETEVKWLAPDGTEWKPPEEELEHRYMCSCPFLGVL